MPTLAALTNVDLPERKLDGLDISSLIKDSGAETPHAAWHWALGKQWAVRKGDWKLLGNARDTADRNNVTAYDEPFLANLADDPGERENRASEFPAIVEDLTAFHEDWLATL